VPVLGDLWMVGLVRAASLCCWRSCRLGPLVGLDGVVDALVVIEPLGAVR